MARTPSTMLELGTSAPDFSLAEPATGNTVSLADFNDKPLLVLFICNHCPFVIHIREALGQFAKDYLPQGLAIVAINANDATRHPDDSPEKMADEARSYYPFPYLFDDDQSVAKAYRAACTPDIYLFDKQHRLVYRGQFDGSRPGNTIAVTGEDLRQAADAVLTGHPVTTDQKPSLGCNIKWLPGNEPDYFG